MKQWDKKTMEYHKRVTDQFMLKRGSKMENLEDIEEIFASYINGNISDTKKAIKQMDKKLFLHFIVMLNYHNNEDFRTTINQVWRLVG